MWLSLLCVWKENGVVPSAEMGVALGRSHSLFTWPPQALSFVSWCLVLCENAFHHNLLSQHPLRPLLSTTVVHMWVGVTISNPSILVQPPFPEAPPPALVVRMWVAAPQKQPIHLGWTPCPWKMPSGIDGMRFGVLINNPSNWVTTFICPGKPSRARHYKFAAVVKQCPYSNEGCQRSFTPFPWCIG